MELTAKADALSDGKFQSQDDHDQSTTRTDAHNTPETETQRPEKGWEHDAEKGGNLTGHDVVLGPNAPVADLGLETGDEKVALDHEKSEVIADHEKAEGGEDDKKDEKAQEEEEDESQYPGGYSLAILTFGLCMATFVVALDNTIIATAMCVDQLFSYIS